MKINLCSSLTAFCLLQDSKAATARQLARYLSMACVFAAIHAGDCIAANTGCVGGNCIGVPADGISYTSGGVTTVNISDGGTGTTVVTPGVIGVELTRTGVSGGGTADAEFKTILWDTDNNTDTTPVGVVSRDGTTPYLINNDYIYVQSYDANGNPSTFNIGSDTASYNGTQLAQFLYANSSDNGAVISGSLTVNNNSGPLGQGGAFSTTNAGGIVGSSAGGKGGSGGCYTVLFWSWCDDAHSGGNAGSVVVNSNSTITVNGTAEGKHGVTAVSQGGDGGDGGGWFGLFGSSPGAGGNGGNGGDVYVTLGEASNITTNGGKSHGVFAQSRGGNGGHGGNASGLVALGDNGGNGGNAGNVVVDNGGSIRTTGTNSHGIYARSVGAGAGSGSDSGGLYAEGGNGGGESSGGMVTVNNHGMIITENSDSFGILAQSIGGGGGDGGDAGGWFTVGGRAGSGGGSAVVSVHDSGTVRTGVNRSTTAPTAGDRSTAIFAQSIGGGGGNGGDAVSVASTLSVAVGGNGGLGGNGNEVHVIAAGSDIGTSGDEAHGIHAQSVGGGGGNGGLAISGTLPGNSPVNVSVALGGNGGGGGNAGNLVNVQTTSGTTIDTTGKGSYGIIAQSIGGGGGNGATSLSEAGGPGFSVAVSIGGTGGVAGAGKQVEVANAGTITTHGDLSAGIFTQSIGGGGGNGGFAGSLAVGGGAASVSLGGSGGSGGAAGQIDINNTGTIKTYGNSATGIFAQSVGGGGGNGGSAIAGSIGLASVSTTIGGAGGVGNNGDLVHVLNAGQITTQGNNSAGVFAQSVGGGGGTGGDATSLALAGPVAVAVAVGGAGGSGGIGGEIIVGNDGRIQTGGPNSDGVFAQSIGGSGGAGGSATTGTLVFPIEIEGVEIPAISANVAVGGRGAGGGTAGVVTATNAGEIVTTGFLSNGVFAQSVGGSGGKGGHATNISIAYDAMFTGKVAVGGSGGQGGTGNIVTVENSGLIQTWGDYSNGVFAQSVGGGGGTGGNATNISLSLTPPPTAPGDFIPTPSANFDLAFGGNGGTGATGGDVTVTNHGNIVTNGHFAAGVMAQSVGGGGGAGGDARTIQVELTADPMDFLPLTALAGLDMTLVFGGTGGTGSHGGIIQVTNESNVTTTGAFSHGIVAQSVGGGGGSGGSAMTFAFSNADVVPEIPVLDDISGLTTIKMTLQGSGGAGGNGGSVTVKSSGDIRTSGAFAMGIVAQSVAGGGGLAGFFNPQGVTNNTLADSLISTFVDTDAGLSFAGSVGGAGTAGDVIVNHTGSIQTVGDGAHGIFAQSAAGQGAGGKVDVTLESGQVAVTGIDADGIQTQSVGLGGAGNITITVNGGTVQGGSGLGAGVRILSGIDNTLTNHGTITTVNGFAGNALIGTTGNDTVSNFGTVTGSVNLGSGHNSFSNQAAANFNTGSVVSLGAGNTLTNSGILSPGGSGNVIATTLSGNFVQNGTGTLAIDLDSVTGNTDQLNVSGTSNIAGTAIIHPINTGYAVPGNRQSTILTSGAGISNNGLELAVQKSAVVNYQLLYPDSSKVVLETTIDFCPQKLAGAHRVMGDYINKIQLSGGAAALAPVINALINLPDLPSLDAAYGSLSPDSYAGVTGVSHTTTAQYLRSVNSRMQSIRSYGMASGGAVRSDIQLDKPLLLAYNGSDASIAKLYTTGKGGQAPQNYGIWIDGFGKWGDQQGDDGFTGLNYHQAGSVFGLDFLVGDRLIIGAGGGYSYTSISLDDKRGGGNIKSGFGSLYGSYFTKQLFVDATFSYSRQDFRNSRTIVVGNIQNGAYSEHSGDVYAMSMGGGYNVAFESWLLQPLASLTCIHLVEEGFQETGAGNTNLIVGERTSESLASELGVRLAKVIQTGIGSIVPEVRASWKYDFDVDDNVVSAAFVSSPNIPLVVSGQHVSRNGAAIVAGMTFLQNGGLAFSLKYDGEFRRDYSSNGVFGEIRYSF